MQPDCGHALKTASALCNCLTWSRRLAAGGNDGGGATSNAPGPLNALAEAASQVTCGRAMGTPSGRIFLDNILHKGCDERDVHREL